MKRNIKHYSDEATHTANKQHRKTGSNEANLEEYLFNSDKNSDGDGKNRKKYNRNEQKRMHLHRLH